MSNFKINRSSLSGVITPPPSKSHSIRALLFGSLASGKSKINSILQSPDIEAMEQACKIIGALIEKKNDNYYITGCNGAPTINNNNIDIGNSGQVLRFMSAICALQNKKVILQGDNSANARPMQALIGAINQLGGKCDAIKKNGCAPIEVNGPLKGNLVTIDGADSQPVSALLMALPFLSYETKIMVNNPGEKPWIDLTCFWLDKVGIHYQRTGYSEFKLEGNAKINGFDYNVPSDFSSAAYSLVAALITNSHLTINNLDFNDVQGDKEIINVCLKMGAKLKIDGRTLKVLPSKLQAIEIDLNNCIDAVPIVAVLATKVIGETRLTNIQVARTKECDRLAIISKELNKMGADIKEYPDSLVIKQSKLSGANVQSHHDHRIAMSLSVAGLIATGDTIVEDVDCINKSYPNFVKDMKSINCQVNVV